MSPVVDIVSCTSDWPAAGVRAIGLSQSLPTPNTHEPPRVVTSDAFGAPEEALAFAVAPIAPDPPLPDVSTPVNDSTVIDDTVACETVAVTVTLLSVAGENARQISDVPLCALLRTTSDHERPAPATLVTAAVVPLAASVATKASSSSFAEVVENDGDATDVEALVRSADVLTSIATAAAAVEALKMLNVKTAAARARYTRRFMGSP